MNLPTFLLGMLVGAIIGACIGDNFVSKQRREAVEVGAAEWVADQKTGQAIFKWRAVK